MRNESRLYLGIGSFFLLILLIYFFWSGESTGSVLLLATVGLGIMPGLYIGWWSRRMRPRAEDKSVLEPTDFSGVVGSFPENTIWPFTLGMGAWLTGLAFVFGLWTAIVGMGFVLAAVVGSTMESRRASFTEKENQTS
ncbi:MAG: aa3-type cytochrome oxidase subunit IV [Ferrimicrobium sp.]